MNPVSRSELKSDLIMPTNQLNITLSPADREKIKRLMVILTGQGVDLRNPKHPESNSISALVRYLVNEELARQQQTGGKGGA